MLTAVLVVLGAVAAWLLVDRLLLQRDERRQPNRTFHSTGWEETVPPLEPSDLRLEPLRRRAQDRATA